MSEYTQLPQKETDEEMMVLNYKFLRYPSASKAVFVLICLLTAGIAFLIDNWFYPIRRLKFRQCFSENATHIEVFDKTGVASIIPLQKFQIDPATIRLESKLGLIEINLFEYKFTRFFSITDSQKVQPLIFRPNLDSEFKGLTQFEAEEKLKVFGQCLINIPMPSIFQLLFQEAIHPFFIFQIFSIMLWMYDDYVLYSFVILFFTIISLIDSIWETRSNVKNVRELALFRSKVQVIRDGQLVEIESEQLVPEDILKLSKNMIMPCDSVLISGSSLVDESMLTGESIPVSKERFVRSHSRLEKKSILSSGTTILFCNEGSYAFVVGTGFQTAKGEIIRSIIFPKDTRFRFHSDSFKFIGFLAILSVIGLIWNIIVFMQYGQTAETIIVSSLDLVTIVVPPTLPISLTIGISFAAGRLKKQGISCISPSSINSAGRVSLVCFDKTGTITLNSVNFRGVWDFSKQKFFQQSSNASKIFKECLGTCHSLSLLDGEIVGDNLELSIFNSLNYSLKPSDEYRIEVVNQNSSLNVSRVFQFNSESKQMGCIAITENRQYLFVKGAPEVVINQCVGEKDQLLELVQRYSKQGLRIIACAYKQIDEFDEKAELYNLTNEMEFIGLVLLQNDLKPNSTEIMDQLQSANIKCVISTGDNPYTSISVGKDSHILNSMFPIVIVNYIDGKFQWIDENDKELDEFNLQNDAQLVVSGVAFENMINSNFRNLLQYNGKIFFRMTPKHKIQLVQFFQQDDIMVAMCGDGANDCGALKAADVGLSLSQQESSIAAPFTGNQLQSIVDLLCEGRCALVTSFQCFKYMTMYSLIQFMAVDLLYSLDTSFQDMHFLFQDLFIILPLAFFMAQTYPCKKLSIMLPEGSLLSFQIIASIFGQMALQLAMQVGSYFTFKQLPWYVWHSGDIEDPEPCYENTLIFIISSLQLIAVCLAFSIGKPFRKPFYRNIALTCTIVLLSGLTVCFVLLPYEQILQLGEIVKFPIEFQVMLIAILAINFALCLAVEKLIKSLSQKLNN